MALSALSVRVLNSEIELSGSSLTSSFSTKYKARSAKALKGFIYVFVKKIE